MKNNFTFILLWLLCVFSLNIRAQTSIEQFEDESNASSSFTDNGVIFNIISNVNTYDIQGAYPNTGWNGTANDNRYIDNTGSANQSVGTSFSIKTTSNLFTVNRFWVYASASNLNLNVSGTLTITGKLDGVTKFTHTKTTGFVTSLGSTNGYTLIDLTNLDGQNYSNIVIDELQITGGGNFQYLGVDAFTWVKNAGTILTSTSPTVTTSAATTITATGATFSGNVTADGGATVTERGFVYGTSTNPTTSNTKIQDGTGTGTFSEAITGLTAGTTYYVRAYAINSVGTAYGNEVSFTTLSSIPVSLYQQLYWPNYEARKIESKSLSGGSRQDVVLNTSATNYGAIGITVDAIGEKVYWFDDT
ncbi:hypothetical protein ABS764_13350, partial [Flavobacterium sp. ST-87]